KNCHTDQPRTSPAINSKKETITKGNNQLIQNFPSASCCPLTGNVRNTHKDAPSRPIDEAATVPFIIAYINSKTPCATGHDTLLYVLTSLRFIEPPPLKKPITPKTRKNKIGKKTNHSRKSRLIENHSFLPSAMTGCRNIWRALFVLRFFFFLLLPSLSWIQPLRKPRSTSAVATITLTKASNTIKTNGRTKSIPPLWACIIAALPQLTGTHLGNTGKPANNYSST